VLKLLTNNIITMKAIVSAFVVMAAAMMISCGGNASKPAQVDSAAIRAKADSICRVKADSAKAAAAADSIAKAAAAAAAAPARPARR